MPRTSSKKRAAAAREDALMSVLEAPVQTGMPAPDSVVAVIPFTPSAGPATTSARSSTAARAATARESYTILRTNEIDQYEEEARPGARATATAARRPATDRDNFAGTSRKAAKLSIANAPTRRFNDLQNLIRSLPSDRTMIERRPRIGVGATSNRVEEEKSNVRVRVFLYAASREDDNDFHLILGRDPSASPETYMTMELSGLPPSNSQSFAKLKAARDAFKEFFGDDMPGTRYDFYRPPIPVEIEGSLFFDMSHSSGSRPGPASLKSRMPTIWEVHPITKIVFEP